MVSILAPRCRGAHQDFADLDLQIKAMFQSSRPVAGARIISLLALAQVLSMFQSSRPVAGARILQYLRCWRPVLLFQSSRPVAGARIRVAMADGARPRVVSILAPRCRGAHQAARQ